jgi:hypothetical protein
MTEEERRIARAEQIAQDMIVRMEVEFADVELPEFVDLFRVAHELINDRFTAAVEEAGLW